MLSKSNRQKIALGEAAVRDELVDAVELFDILRLQAFELLQHAIENDFARSAFRPGLRSFQVPAQIHFPHVLLELSRGKAESFEIDRDRSSSSVKAKIFLSFPGIRRSFSSWTVSGIQ